MAGNRFSWHCTSRVGAYPRLGIPREEFNPPLNKRSWVAQEYVLSPRVLSFGSVHTYFACNEGWRCESLTCSTTQILRRDMIGLQNEPDIPKNLLMQETDDVHRLWYTTVNQYTKKSLTWGKDNLPALSGLARRLGRRLPGDKYVAGLWRSDILNGLSWWTALPVPGAIGMERRYQYAPKIPAPTWSWASTDRPVSFSKPYHEKGPSDFLAEFESVDCIPVGRDLFGEVRSGVLSLRVTVQPILAVEPIYDSRRLVPMIHITGSSQSFPVDPDRLNASAHDLRLHDRPIFIFPLCCEKFSEDSFRCFAIVLEVLDEDTRCFRRIGCVEGWMGRAQASSLGYFSTERSSITII